MKKNILFPFSLLQRRPGNLLKSSTVWDPTLCAVAVRHLVDTGPPVPPLVKHDITTTDLICIERIVTKWQAGWRETVTKIHELTQCFLVKTT